MDREAIGRGVGDIDAIHKGMEEIVVILQQIREALTE
jgi:hypothetical protein